MHQVMEELKFKLAVSKTFIGKLSRGLDFLGYHFSCHGQLSVAKKTIENAKERLLMLYEQGAPPHRVQQYVNRWLAWAAGGLQQTLDFKPQEIGDYYETIQRCVNG